MTLHQTNESNNERINQGEILKNVPYFESYTENNGEFALTVLDFPFVIVLTQDCDLEQNKRDREKQNQSVENTKKTLLDKHLISIIVAPLYNSEHLFSGEHLSLLGIESHKPSSEQKKLIKQNQNPRYHYIEFNPESPIPNAVIDFKHYFSISLEWLESNPNKKVCVISPIYRELVSQRFSNYLSRIGLP